MLTYGQMCYQAERAKTPAEQREADAQLGQLFAALAGLLRSLARPLRAFAPPVSHRTAGLRACTPAGSASSLPRLGHRSST
jgi:hypothetical protein